MAPRGAPKATKKEPKIDQKCTPILDLVFLCFGSAFGSKNAPPDDDFTLCFPMYFEEVPFPGVPPFFDAFSSLLGPQNAPKSDPNSVPKPRHFFAPFLSPPRPPRCRFGEKVGPKRGPKMAKRRPKSNFEGTMQSSFFGPFFGLRFFSSFVPFWSPFGLQIGPLGSPLAPFWCHLRPCAPFFVESWPQVASKLNGAHAQSAKK